MWLIAGLGNPGKEYAFTRHNIGFMAVDLWAEGLMSRTKAGEKSQLRWSTEEKAQVAKTKWAGQDILLVKPQTYMNHSGDSVQPLLAYYKIPMENLIVVHDEIDLPFQSMKFQKNRGAGGHNGIKSISERLASNDYIRMKVGIGRPAHPDMEVPAHVLGRFSAAEAEALPLFLNWCGDAVEMLIRNGLPKASSLFNGAFTNNAVSKK